MASPRSRCGSILRAPARSDRDGAGLRPRPERKVRLPRAVRPIMKGVSGPRLHAVGNASAFAVVPVALALLASSRLLAVAAGGTPSGGVPDAPSLSPARPAATAARVPTPTGLPERADVELVLVPVSIREPDGTPIAGLQREDFTLFEAGAPQEIATFDRDPTPVSIVFGVDTSGSMEPYLAFVKAAAIRFVQRIPPVFDVSLVSFADVTTRRCDFTKDRRHLYYELNTLRANGGATAILDATREAIAAVSRRPGRRAVVIFTDGEENAVEPEDIEAVEDRTIRAARAADVTVYYVGYGWVELPQMLEQVAAATGGEYLAAGRERKITQSFDAIARALDSQYTLGYVPRPGRPGEWRPIKVEVRHTPAQVVARAGYLVPASSPVSPVRP